MSSERVYDHMPDRPEMEDWGFRKPSIADLEAEMARRSPEWRPAWVRLLEGEVLHHPPAGLLARARGESAPSGVSGG
ncbi:hypothetical protein [Nocardiopsis salina]|uniref:hypothetical protein n=1 Tax=Nocardiopsis salina TaxID=245836 RepID=UPI00034A1DEF|nr:hypothetical protein [Nocardiopsis salina]